MKKCMYGLLLAVIFTACEKTNDKELLDEKALTEEVPVVTGIVEVQFLNWEPQGINHKVAGKWVQSDLEMTLRYYGDEMLPLEQALDSSTFILPLDSITYKTTIVCNPDRDPRQVARFNLERKRGWYMVSTKFLFSTGKPETYEYNDTLRKCYSYNDEGYHKIFVGEHDYCYSNDMGDIHNYYLQ